MRKLVGRAAAARARGEHAAGDFPFIAPPAAGPRQPRRAPMPAGSQEHCGDAFEGRLRPRSAQIGQTSEGTKPASATRACSTEGGTRRVRLVREEGRDVSSQYGEGGGG